MSIASWISRNVFWPVDEFREGKSVLKTLKELNRSQYLGQDELNAIRLDRLRKLLDQAWNNCPFYRERFEQTGTHPSEIKDFSDLAGFPLLTKADLIQSADRLLAQNIPAKDRHRSATGGSTGQHTPFYRDNASLEKKTAAQFRFMQWAGWNIGEKVSLFWPAVQEFASDPSFKSRLRNWLIDRRQKHFAGKLDEQLMEQYARDMSRFSPKIIRAFPNPLSIFARFLEENPVSPQIRPRGIVTVGEPLLSSQRELFTRVFDCPVFDCYVSRECGHLAAECQVHDGLHINADNVHLEFLDNQNRPVADGQPGRIVITDFQNYGMPFIRYDIGDFGTRMDTNCSCGRTLPKMRMEAGRISDFVRSPHDNSWISGASLCHYLLAEGPVVGQLQIIQDGIDHLTIRICNALGNDTRRVNQVEADKVLDKLFHGKMRVTWEDVRVIERENSGKYRFCINKLELSN